MKKALILTSILAISTAPAFATPTTESTFTGTMLENRSYTGAATETNTGITSGTVTAEAYYTWDLHNVAPGTYWPHSTVWNDNATPNPAVAECLANSFCPGQSDAHYDDVNDQGITSCSTLSGGFNSSDAGASAANQCYRTCDINNYTEQEIAAFNLGPVTAITGRDYYDDGVDACEASACELGYHVSGGTGGGTSVDLNNEIAAVNGVRYGAVRGSNGELVSQASAFGLTTTDLNKFAVQYNEGTVIGQARCSTQGGTSVYGVGNSSDGTTRFELTDETGHTGANYCYCQLEEWISVSGERINLSAAWVFDYDANTASNCAYRCANSCGYDLITGDNYHLPFRSTVFGAVIQPSGQEYATCQPNEITITWRGAEAADIAANNAGTALYAGDINTPVAAKHQAGKSFSGWRFLLNDANGQPTSTPVQMSTPASADPINNGAMPYVAPSSGNDGN